jgi:hypothetical protein
MSDTTSLMTNTLFDGLFITIQYYYGDQSKEDEMGGACGAHGGDEGCIQHFGWEA